MACKHTLHQRPWGPTLVASLLVPQKRTEGGLSVFPFSGSQWEKRSGLAMINVTKDLRPFPVALAGSASPAQVVSMNLPPCWSSHVMKPKQRWSQLLKAKGSLELLAFLFPYFCKGHTRLTSVNLVFPGPLGKWACGTPQAL